MQSASIACLRPGSQAGCALLAIAALSLEPPPSRRLPSRALSGPRGNCEGEAAANLSEALGAS
jgi:hypothetical protein